MNLTNILAAIEKIEARIDTIANMKPDPAVLGVLSTLQEQIEALDAADNPPASPRKYLATGRVTLPPMGGLALPKGVGFHGYVSVEVKDLVDEDGRLIIPTRESVDAYLSAVATQKFPGHVGVELATISTLPGGW